MFLGYPSNKKGYRLLNLLTDIVFVSRDVRFFEHIFPYKVFKPKFDQTNTPLSANAYDDYDEWL